MTGKRLADTEEGRRLFATEGADAAWRRWGTYLSDRQWGTVREDYSAEGDAWRFFPHDHARRRAYRWGEDGIAGWSDERSLWCLSLALWNGRDTILKERLFGLANGEGNHGEDVKELYYYVDGTPTHSYMRMLYKYPQAAFPYDRLVAENRRRGFGEPEYELIDTGVFDEDRYFDVFVEYAKNDPDDAVMRVTVANRGPDPATIDVVPQLFARNTWSWDPEAPRPSLAADADGSVHALHPELPPMRLVAEADGELLFCRNETDAKAVWGSGPDGFFKDAIGRFIVGGETAAVDPARQGTKCGVRHRLVVPAGDTACVRLRFGPDVAATRDLSPVDTVIARRRAESDEFYDAVHGAVSDGELRQIQREAFAGLLWSKQFYRFDVRRWLEGDPAGPKPPASRWNGRNADWQHVVAGDVISMPDAWEYPWFASWDLCLQSVAFAAIDPSFAKTQLLLLTHSWYMHPNASLPAYEWSFSDANPPLHAHAAIRVFEADRAITGTADWSFLRRIFQKLPMNFTWWTNRKDEHGRNVFQGGFLGLDNIGIFDRSAPLPFAGSLTQSDGTAWMAMYALDCLRIAVMLGEVEPDYQDLAVKFFEHFLLIAKADAEAGGTWDEEDGFFYDVLQVEGQPDTPIRVRTMVGLIPIFAVAVLTAAGTSCLPRFVERLRTLLQDRPDLAALVSRWDEPGQERTMLLSLLRGHRLKLLLARMLDEREFLSPHGVRAVSKAYDPMSPGGAPFRFEREGRCFTLDYEPAESRTGLFGGNSNWRGPVWMPVNYLLIESLRQMHAYYGPGFRVAWPDGSGRTDDLAAIADELSRRLVGLFRRSNGRRPVHGDVARLQDDPHFRDLLLFYEYFDGDTGRGVGASHQTGWTALVALLIGVTGAGK